MKKKSEGLQRQMLVLVEKKKKRSKDSAMTVVIMQIYYERINKLKTSPKIQFILRL